MAAANGSRLDLVVGIPAGAWRKPRSLRANGVVARSCLAPANSCVGGRASTRAHAGAAAGKGRGAREVVRWLKRVARIEVVARPQPERATRLACATRVMGDGDSMAEP